MSVRGPLSFLPLHSIVQAFVEDDSVRDPSDFQAEIRAHRARLLASDPFARKPKSSADRWPSSEINHLCLLLSMSYAQAIAFDTGSTGRSLNASRRGFPTSAH
jgi:hypothetical protein